ncbi:MAG: DUF4093 domain-containing protein [Oscillospiraceae bacterium]
MEKITINAPIIVEGKYDKIKLDSIINGVIIKTDGFRLYKDKEKISMIKALANKNGVIVLTDSDVAGFKIRNYLKNTLKGIKIINIYIPQIKGKEKRKTVASKEGFLGVEGIDVSLLKELFLKAGVLSEKQEIENPITKTDFLSDGLIGMDNSSVKREFLLKQLNLPVYLSTKAILEIINSLIDKQQYRKIIENIEKMFN